MHVDTSVTWQLSIALYNIESAHSRTSRRVAQQAVTRIRVHLKAFVLYDEDHSWGTCNKSQQASRRAERKKMTGKFDSRSSAEIMASNKYASHPSTQSMARHSVVLEALHNKSTDEKGGAHTAGTQGNSVAAGGAGEQEDQTLCCVKQEPEPIACWSVNCNDSCREDVGCDTCISKHSRQEALQCIVLRDEHQAANGGHKKGQGSCKARRRSQQLSAWCRHREMVVWSGRFSSPSGSQPALT